VSEVRRKERQRKRKESVSQKHLLTSMVFSKYTKAKDVALALAEDSPYWPRIADS
jgi:hypothetical protein